MNIEASTCSYEAWLGNQLQGELVRDALLEKHDEMKKSSFVFLRATYWRWAEVIPPRCPDLMSGPSVLAVGDVHVENFGTWRDADGRLVWGINDFDEAAEMPYGLDLARLATSACLGRPDAKASIEDICESILKGYMKGLKDPEPFVLDRKHSDMRSMFVASEDARDDFWKKFNVKKGEGQPPPPPRFRQALDAAMPKGAQVVAYWPRSAGTGSLGRLRWVALANWKGGPVVREAKAIVNSAWSYAQGSSDARLRVEELAEGRYRAADPWYHLSDGILVRRLSPNNHKIEVKALGASLFAGDLLEKMGLELANTHLALDVLSDAIRGHLKQRSKEWLLRATAEAVKVTEDDFADWRKSETKFARDPPACARWRAPSRTPQAHQTCWRRPKNDPPVRVVPIQI